MSFGLPEGITQASTLLRLIQIPGSSTQTVNSLQRMDLSRMEDADIENDAPETEDEIPDLSER
jgi:hypothetical protein